MVHRAAGATRRPKRPRLRGRHPAADDRGHPSPRRARGAERPRDPAPRHPTRSAAAGEYAGCRADRRRFPRDGAAGRAAPEPGAVAQADRARRYCELHEGGRRARTAAGGPRGRRPRDPRRRGRRPAAGRTAELPPLRVHARLREGAGHRLMSRLPAFFPEYHARVDAELARLVPTDGERVQQAMAYTVHAPSKRVRPVLTLLCAELCGGGAARAVPAASVVELVHAASLILDDLPCMDDAPIRRGREANHRVFGEAIAILAAFGLLNLASGALAREYEPQLSVRLASLLSDAIGIEGLIGGQALDLLATDRQISFEVLERIHRGKTGALFSASATAGALTAGAGPDAVAALAAFAKNLGLAFQMMGELLH